MVFWRKKKNIKEQEQEEREDRVIHHPDDPELEPPIEYEAKMDEALKHELEETEIELLEDLEQTPVPEHMSVGDAMAEEVQKQDEEDAHAGGWFSRLTSGLSKSSNKIGQGITDLLTKSTLDQETLDKLEDLLIEADLGPKTASDLVARLSKDRFGKEVTQEEVRESLAEYIAEILDPVAHELAIENQGKAPFVILVCGVNGAGKTTTIGKLAHTLHQEQGRSVMMAAGDTFRAAAIEQLGEWSKRAHCSIVAKDVGADAAAVAYEAYEKAKEQGVDVLLIDTAGRLHNKSNLMDELNKIVRVLKKHDESIPHATLLVLDATTGQNAHAQLETFKDMTNVTGLIVTKLDGSAKGGVLVSLADQFGIPVHAIGVGEGIRDMRPFRAEDYARSLMGISEDKAA